MKTYFDVVTDIVGIENICNGPSNGPVSEIKFRNGFANIPNEEEIQTKLAELQAAEPMRLLRIQRDKKLQESDWRTNNDYPYDDADAWATYRTALRNLPAVISTGNVAAPVIQDGALVFDDWPQVPNA